MHRVNSVRCTPARGRCDPAQLRFRLSFPRMNSCWVWSTAKYQRPTARDNTFLEKPQVCANETECIDVLYAGMVEVGWVREQSVGPTCSHTCHQTQHQCEVKGQVLVGARPERRDRRSVEIVCQRCCGNGDCRCTRWSHPIWVACLWPSLCLWVVTDEVRRADYKAQTAHHPRVPLLLNDESYKQQVGVVDLLICVNAVVLVPGRLAVGLAVGLAAHHRMRGDSLYCTAPLYVATTVAEQTTGHTHPVRPVGAAGAQDRTTLC